MVQYLWIVPFSDLELSGLLPTFGAELSADVSIVDLTDKDGPVVVPYTYGIKRLRPKHDEAS